MRKAINVAGDMPEDKKPVLNRAERRKRVKNIKATFGKQRALNNIKNTRKQDKK